MIPNQISNINQGSYTLDGQPQRIVNQIDNNNVNLFQAETPSSILLPLNTLHSTRLNTNKIGPIQVIKNEESYRLRIQIKWKNIAIYPEPELCSCCEKDNNKIEENISNKNEYHPRNQNIQPRIVFQTADNETLRVLHHPEEKKNSSVSNDPPIIKKDKNVPKLILDNVSGTVLPGQFLTIIGASGSGKTTLLSYLSGKSLAKNLIHKGEVFVNDIPRDQIEYNLLTAFVQQDDVLTDFMSVRENIFFACQLRAPGNEEEMNQRCDELIKSLGLYHVQNQRIGGVMKKIISGGERKRTSIAVELISKTPLIFLDEPTTGLDSVMATKITESLVNYSRGGNTIIATIHQPNSEMFKMFDQLMLLSQGKVLYFNKSNLLIDYFKGLGKPKYTCPERMNPSEFAMILMSSETFTELKGQEEEERGPKLTAQEALIKYENRVKKLVNFYDKSPFKCNIEQKGENLSELSQENIGFAIYRAKLTTQIYILFSRAMRLQLRKFVEDLVRYIAIIFMSLLTIAIYYNLSNTGPAAFTDRMGIYMMICMVGFMTAMNSAITTFPEERAVFMREQVSGLYEVLPYYAGKLLCEYPFIIIDPILVQLTLYWSCKLRNEASVFWIALACGILLGFYGYAFSLLLGIIVAKREAVFLAMPVVFIPLMLLSGFYADLSSIFPILWIFQWISPFKYGMIIYMKNEMNGVLYEFNTLAQGARRFVLGDVILDTYGFDLSVSISFISLICLYVGFTILGYIMVKIFVWRMKS